MTKRYLIKREKCECTLYNFYKNVAEVTGKKNLDELQYDCRKICVTKPVQESIRKFYLDEGYGEGEIGALFLIGGPKANLDGDDYAFEVEKGFAVRMK